MNLQELFTETLQPLKESGEMLTRKITTIQNDHTVAQYTFKLVYGLCV
jgi:hypothetical protein